MTDQFGRRSGYAYEYQQKIAAYTGWNYEYVEGTWPELYQMFLNGELDLMSDVSYTEERAEVMLFPTLPMGAEVYYACISAQRDSDITIDDLSSFNGKRVGVNKDTYQEKLFLEWEQKNGVEAEIVELMVNEAESIQLLDEGVIDAFITPDTYGAVQTMIPVCKIGYSNFYFAVRKDRPDLLRELDSALNRIQDEDRNYNQHLQEEYLSSNAISLYLPQNEVNWLSGHGPIRVGYQDNYLAFCERDPETGELIGALRAFLDLASGCLQNAEIAFETVAYPTAKDALDAMQRGEVDCVFPVNLTTYDGETLGVLTTSAEMKTEMYAAVRASHYRDVSLSMDLTVAIHSMTATVHREDPNYNTFLMDYFPNWKQAYFDSEEACIRAVADQEADCVLICNYRLNRTDEMLKKYDLFTLSTGRSMGFSFAVRRNDDYLYALLNKLIRFVPETSIHSALASYSYVERRFTLTDFLRENMLPVLGVLEAVLLVIFALLIRSRRAEKKAKQALANLRESLKREAEQEKELTSAKKKAYVDPLTGVKNKTAYLEATDSLQLRISSGLAPEFAVAVFDVNDLKRVNDVEGHEAGDRHIQNASAFICETFKHSPVYRVGGDEFTAILEGRDYENRTELMDAFNRTAEENRKSGKVVVSAGVAAFKPEKDATFKDVFQRADVRMYERKKFLKGGREIR